MVRRPDPGAGFLEKMLAPLSGEEKPSTLRWVGDPIRDHLTLLLNAHKGSVEHLPDYGMPDMATFYADYPASLTGLRKAVEELIQSAMTGPSGTPLDSKAAISGIIPQEHNGMIAPTMAAPAMAIFSF